MKFIRPAAEVEAMEIRDANGAVTGYYVDFLDGKATKMFTVEDLQSLGFRKANGNEIGKERKRPERKKKAQPIAEIALQENPVAIADEAEWNLNEDTQLA